MGRDVAAALGLTRRGEGFIQGPGDIVTWCVGHLVELDDPEAYDPKLKSWRLDTLPIIPEKFKYHPIDRTRDQFGVLRELLGRADVEVVVNAADAGREGELIFDLVYALSKCRKPVRRLWISSLTRDSILEGFRNLRPGEEYRGLRATAVFNKTWEFDSPDKNSKGSVRQQLTLVKAGGRWLINGEKDLQVYYSNTEDY